MLMESHSFRRIVLGLQPRARDDIIPLAVEFADLLHLDLLGLFLEDTSLSSLANLPFAREFRPLGGGWHSIDIDRLAHDAELAARSVERMVGDAAKRLATRYQFEVARGPMSEIIASVSQPNDIVVIVEPISQAERASQQFSWLVEAAFRSAAAVLLVPPRIVRMKGPIAAVAAGPDDPSIRAAAAVALAAKEELIVIDVCEPAVDDARTRALAAELGLKIKHIAASKTLLSHPTDFSPALHQVQERLLVMTRGTFADRVASTIASARHVPVLVVEPTDMATAESRKG
jgi:hypothetical protein